MAFSIFNLGKEREHVKNEVVKLPLAQIVPNRYQPRQVFDQDGIAELAQTISEHGLLQPMIVRAIDNDQYEIIAGERRFRAMTLLEWETVPAIVETMDDDEVASLALIENLQRSELTAVEEAQAYRRLMDLNHLTQRTLAKGMGKSQSFIANKLRLLQLSESVQTAVLNRQISERHGRALLNLKAPDQEAVLADILANGWTVRETEDAVAERLGQVLPSVRRAQKQREILGLQVADDDQNMATPPANHTKGKQTQPAVTDVDSAVAAVKKAVTKIKGTGYEMKVTTRKTANGMTVSVKLTKPEVQDD